MKFFSHIDRHNKSSSLRHLNEDSWSVLRILARFKIIDHKMIYDLYETHEVINEFEAELLLWDLREAT